MTNDLQLVPDEGVFHFSGRPLQELARAAQRATTFRKPYPELLEPEEETHTTTPSLWLVKDAGLYLTNAAGANASGTQDPPLVCDCHEQGVVFGGDDFVEIVPIDGILDDLATGRCGLKVALGPETLDIRKFRVPLREV